MEITIISAENLCMNGKPIEKDTYVVVHTQSCTKFFTTRTEEEGGRNNPSWNEKFLVDGVNSITLEVQCKTWLGFKSLGAARIAVSEFVSETSLQFLSYRLWDEKGKRNGVINFSVRVVKAPQERESSCSMVEIEKNWREFGMQVTMGENDAARTVTGVPVFWNFPLNIPR
ncbi:BON1-associated protein 1-like [Vigna unguiculata]|uniref:C2 domain-containing protein n=1 Tax=Vigna unguiculata TaxID=3917 RepID=A0A4D6NEI2_VIGUN|nr:BON1-associated protein 1-like [Vigna unguiculata]QCE12220.1 hypothetical protein DEO72_LG10g3461 [Vigna unguiculata]